jgi:WhiB family transcriptional regulator, redox-sensing transcriptional regulator
MIPPNIPAYEELARLHIDPAELEFGKQGLCNTEGHGPDVFFLEDHFHPNSKEYRDAVARARAICARCPVQKECLHFAMKHYYTGCDTGIWGGKTFYERQQLKYPRRKINGKQVYLEREHV